MGMLRPKHQSDASAYAAGIRIRRFYLYAL